MSHTSSRFHIPVTAASLLLAAAGGSLAALAHAPTLTPVEPDECYNNTLALGISADGSMVVGEALFTTAFWSQSGGIVEHAAYPASINCQWPNAVFDVSEDGEYACGWHSSIATPFGFRWHKSGSVETLPPIPGGSTALVFPSHISADGSVLAGVARNSTNDLEAFRWENGITVGLGDLPGGDFQSSIDAMTPDGSVLVGRSDAGGGVGDQQWFRWRDGEMETLPVTGGFITGISRDGEIILGLMDGSPVVFMNGELRTIDMSGSARAVSDDGRIIIGSKGSDAWIWTSHGVSFSLALILDCAGQDFNGWRLSSLVDMSADGAAMAGTMIAEKTNIRRAFRVGGIDTTRLLSDLASPGGGGGAPDGAANVFDLLELLANWGSDGRGAAIAEPHDAVDVFDLLGLLGAWGGCAVPPAIG